MNNKTDKPLEPGQRVSIYCTTEDTCADVGRVVCFNEKENIYTISLGSGRGWRDIDVDKVREI